MLKKIAEGILVHQSAFLQSNCTVVKGRDGVLLIDPGITVNEMAGLAKDLHGLGQPVVAAFSTHPHWDHVLWHPDFGDPPRYSTAAGAASIQAVLANENWKDRVAQVLPPQFAEEIPMDLFGLISALPSDAGRIPWDGPTVQILEHRAHTPGHAALWMEDSGVLVAGDMLSDTLMPFLDLKAENPLDDYFEALQLLETVVHQAVAVIPGHGSVGGAKQLRERLAMDRAYVQALQDGREPEDPRVGPTAALDWLVDVHSWQLQRLAERGTN